MLFDSWRALLQTVVVGSVAYLALVLMLRMAGKRTLSKWNAFDLVVTVAFGSTLATMLLSRDTTLAQGVVAFLLLVGLQWTITRISVRWRTLERWVKARPRLLVYRGELRHAALRQERVTEREVHAALRGRGIGTLEEVHAVVLETDGSVSVIRHLRGTPSALRDVQGYPADS